MKPLEDRGPLPRVGLHLACEAIRHHPRQVLREAATCDVHTALHVQKSSLLPRVPLTLIPQLYERSCTDTAYDREPVQEDVYLDVH